MEYIPLLKLVLELIEMAAGQSEEEARLRKLYEVIRHTNDLYARARFGDAPVTTSA